MADGDRFGPLSAPGSLRERAGRAGGLAPHGRATHAVAAPLLVALVASLGFAASFTLLHHSFWGRYQIVDTPLYEAYGDATRAGDIPYRDFRVEYPPGALAAFLAPELTAPPGQFGAYGRAFEKWMAACGIVMTCLVVVALRLQRAGR